MSLKHTYTLSIKNDAGAAKVADSYFVSFEQEENASFIATAGQTTHKPLPTITKADLNSFFVESDQDVTMNINSATSSVQTVALSKGKAYYWNNLLAYANPLSPSTVTDLYFINAGLVNANITWGFGYTE